MHAAIDLAACYQLEKIMSDDKLTLILVILALVLGYLLKGFEVSLPTASFIFAVIGIGTYVIFQKRRK